jgi:signal transduction histidine kinase
MRERHFAGRRERVDMRLLVERIVNDQADLGHAVTFQETESVIVEAAPLALRRLVGNLIDNALKYGERARLKLSRADGLCLLEIDDDGPGIPESLHQQVFEPFFRVEGSRNRDTGGIGLGLAAVRAIVLEHGGEVALANRKSGGLRVSVTLPAVNGG